jgi:type I restriction enzyme S subunit
MGKLMAEEETKATLTKELPEGFKMTELGPLPREWEAATLGKLGKISAGGSAPQESRYFGGNHPFVRVQHLDENGYEVRRWDLITEEAIKRFRLRLFPAGTIVFPKSGASIRLEKRAILPRPCYLVSHLCAIVPNDALVDGNFLFFALKSVSFSANKAEGYPTLSLTEIRQHFVPLPPLSEQRAIAHVLRTVQQAKEATEQVIAALKEFKKSLMRHLFTYGPVPIEQADKVEFKNTEIGLLRNEWEVVSFDKAIAKTVPVPKVNRSLYQSIGSVPVIDQGQPLIAGYVEDIKPYDRELPVIVFGDHTRIFKFVNFPFVAGADGTKVLLPNRAYFDPIFLYYAFTTINIPSRGYNRHFNLLRENKLPKPSLPEQKKIAEILISLDNKIKAEENKKNALETLFKTLLHNLMTGKIRVANVE